MRHKIFRSLKTRPVVISCILVSMLLIAAGINAGTVGITKKIARTKQVVSKPNKTPQQQIPPDLPGTIEGAKTPELIPDHAAYSILFRFISNRETDVEKKRIRSYIRQIIFRCQNCGKPNKGNQQPESDNGDTEALIAIAEQYYQRVKILDQQADEIRGTGLSNLDKHAISQLTTLGTQKEKLALEVAASLPNHLSAAGVENVRRHINEYVKRRIKIVPQPTMTSHN
jgi:hypothetical protein